MKVKKLLLGFGILALSSTFLVACSQQESQKVTTIEVFSQKPETKDVLQSIINDFEKDNKDIKVKFTNVPNPGEMLKSRVFVNKTPDIVHLFPINTEFKMWAKKGLFEDLSNESFMKRLKPGTADSYAIDGKEYTIPLNVNGYGFFYNATKFKELGLKEPTTYAEFKDLIKTIKAKGEVPFALSLSSADSWTLKGYGQIAWVLGNGGSSKKAQDYLRYSSLSSINPQDKIFKETLNYLDLIRENGQPNASGASYNDAITAFDTEQALILPQGIWALPAINQQNPKFEIKSFAFPGEQPGQEKIAGSADLAYSISAKSPHKKEAKRFLEYLTRPEVFQKYYDVDGSPTTIKGVKENKKFAATQGITKYAFTDQRFDWLHKDWDSADEFDSLTSNYERSGDTNQLAQQLNAFFNPMKEKDKER